MSSASMVDDTLADLLCGSVKARRGRGDLRARARRVANYTPEVMVKMTGNVRLGARVGSHMDYISRNGTLDLETEDGHILKSKEEVKELAKEWKKDADNTRIVARLTTNIVLSMPPGTDTDALKNAARAFAKRTFGDNYRYVFVLHTDEKHPHVHLTINNRGFDGQQLHIPKGKPQEWREDFAEELRDQDIEAEATPRAVRGIVPKAIKSAIHHMRKRGVKPRSDIDKSAELVREYKGIEVKEKPWEAAISVTRKRVYDKWKKAAAALKFSGIPGDRDIAYAISGFVVRMPEPLTIRESVFQSAEKKSARGNESKQAEHSYRDGRDPKHELER